MNFKSLFCLAVMVSLIPGVAFAGSVTQADFKAETTQQLLNLCSAAPDDPFYNHAMNFCHGYFQGAYDYYEAAHSGSEGLRMVCFTDPAPTRNQAINKFVGWAKSKPQYSQEQPVDTFFRFLTTTWPCN